MAVNFMEVTEVSGESISREQLQRMLNRYAWAAGLSKQKDVLEVACGTGQGLGCLSKVAKKVHAGDISKEMINLAKQTYQDDSNVDVQVLDVHQLDFPDNSMDVIICFEAIYYFQDIDKFMTECKRVLRPGGKLLISVANPDLYDFNPSPHSVRYYGVVELQELCLKYGLTCKFLADLAVNKVSLVQKVSRPIKKIVIALNIMPKTMAGKQFLKRVVFGKMVTMPDTLTPSQLQRAKKLEPISNMYANKSHKVIFCEASVE